MSLTEFFEAARESWVEWDLNPRPLNSVQMLYTTDQSYNDFVVGITWMSWNELRIKLVFTTEEFFKGANESWNGWYFNSRPLNFLQTLYSTDRSDHENLLNQI